MNVKLVKKTKLINDINEIIEIIELLNKPQFDRKKAENIIVKHNLSNKKVAELNSPLNPYTERLENLTDDDIKSNLLIILSILDLESRKL